jgi:membrane protease YdiL (CAAX protease family)
MKGYRRFSAYVERMQGNSRQLLAAPKHTLGLIAIIFFIAVGGLLSAPGDGHAHSGPLSSSTKMIYVYLLTIGLEWLWVLFIYRGMEKYPGSILDFVGRKPFLPRQLVLDVVSAVLAFITIYALSSGLHGLLDHAVNSPSSNPILPSLPKGSFTVAAWLGLSISAGISEEIVFRGYLQRQLLAITGNPAIAVIGQAIVFGAGHAYQGISSVTAIVMHGLILGLLAQWRGNIRAGILEHTSWDISAGLGII